jgi:hypothetical protein
MFVSLRGIAARINRARFRSFGLAYLSLVYPEPPNLIEKVRCLRYLEIQQNQKAPSKQALGGP